MDYVPYYDIKPRYSVAREIKPQQFARDINDYVSKSKNLLFGIISLNPDAIYEFGELDVVRAEDSQKMWTFVFRHIQTGDVHEIAIPYDHLTATYDVRLTVDDGENGQVDYSVYYMSVTDEKENKVVTYYIAAANDVSHPLDCVAQFFIRAYDFVCNIKQRRSPACQVNRRGHS